MKRPAFFAEEFEELTEEFFEKHEKGDFAVGQVFAAEMSEPA